MADVRMIRAAVREDWSPDNEVLREVCDALASIPDGEPDAKFVAAASALVHLGRETESRAACLASLVELAGTHHP